MSRRKTDPLRTLTEEELESLRRTARSATAPAAEVARAKSLLAVRAGLDYQKAAAAAGRLSGDAVSHLVARFNRQGLQALRPRHGGGPAPTYSSDHRERILREARREPTPELDGTATWSLSLLQQALRAAPDGLPKVSTYTIWRVLHEAGITFQRTRSWCPTGTAKRVRKSGTVATADPDTEAKKN